MSLDSTASELRERADDLLDGRGVDWDRADLVDLADHLSAIADELDQQPAISDLRVIVCGGARNQAALDKAVHRVKAAICSEDEVSR